MLRRFLLIAFLFTLLFPVSVMGQVTVDNTTMTVEELVQEVLLGNGVSVSNITFNGQPADQINVQIGKYEGNGSSTVVEFPEALVMGTNNVNQLVTGEFGDPMTNPSTNDPDLVAISGQQINDGAILEFDFIPNGDSLEFRYVFASNEYPNYTCTNFNDAFGFFLSGPGINGPFSDNAINIALIPDSDVPVAINTVNGGVPTGSGTVANCEDANPNWVEDSQYFQPNDPPEEGDVQIPGMTVTLTAFAEVECGVEYHIKLGIGDASDGALDSGVFLEAGSFTSNSVVNVNLDIPVGIGDSTLYEGCGEAFLQFIRPNNSQGVEETAYIDISGTAQNGVDFTPALPDSVYFPVGVDTVSFALNAPADGNVEGEEFATVTITNIASNCSNAVITSDFTFYVDEEDPLQVESFDGALADCNDAIEIYPTVSGGYGEYSYSWSNGSNSDTITVSPGFTTTYFLVVGDTCGLDDIQTDFEVEVPTYPPVEVDLGEDFIVDECDVTVDLFPVVEGGFGAYSYSWIESGEEISTAPTLQYLVENSTVLELDVTDACGAIGTDDVAITVPEQEVTAFLPDVFEAESCLEDIYLPIISDGGIGLKTYTWFVDGEEQITTADPFFVYNPSMGQNVVVVAEDECENSASDSTEIAFNYPEVEFEAFPADTAICMDTQAQFRIDITGGSGGYKPSWQGTDSTYSYTVSPVGNSSYNVVVEDTCGMIAEKTVFVDVQQPRADFDYEYFGYYGIRFSNYSRANQPAKYFWNFGDGNSSEEENPSHQFADIDPFKVVMTVEDNIGCRDSVSLQTIPPAEVFIPNSFTPNGDGINDLFGIKGANLIDFEMRVFDRWGKLVFHSADPDKKWNGSHQDGSYHNQTSTYNYLIKYRGIAEEDATEITGQVTVIR